MASESDPLGIGGKEKDQPEDKIPNAQPVEPAQPVEDAKKDHELDENAKFPPLNETPGLTTNAKADEIPQASKIPSADLSQLKKRQTEQKTTKTGPSTPKGKPPIKDPSSKKASTSQLKKLQKHFEEGTNPKSSIRNGKDIIEGKPTKYGQPPKKTYITPKTGIPNKEVKSNDQIGEKNVKIPDGKRIPNDQPVAKIKPKRVEYPKLDTQEDVGNKIADSRSEGDIIKPEKNPEYNDKLHKDAINSNLKANAGFTSNIEYPLKTEKNKPQVDPDEITRLTENIEKSFTQMSEIIVALEEKYTYLEEKTKKDMGTIKKEFRDTRKTVKSLQEKIEEMAKKGDSEKDEKPESEVIAITSSKDPDKKPEDKEIKELKEDIRKIKETLAQQEEDKKERRIRIGALVAGVAIGAVIATASPAVAVSVGTYALIGSGGTALGSHIFKKFESRAQRQVYILELALKNTKSYDEQTKIRNELRVWKESFEKRKNWKKYLGRVSWFLGGLGVSSLVFGSAGVSTAEAATERAANQASQNQAAQTLSGSSNQVSGLGQTAAPETVARVSDTFSSNIPEIGSRITAEQAQNMGVNLEQLYQEGKIIGRNYFALEGSRGQLLNRLKELGFQMNQTSFERYLNAVGNMNADTMNLEQAVNFVMNP